MKILNLYAGIGGNRKLWGNTHDITAIEYNPKIAKIYQDFFPNDKVIIADAHQYLLEHYKEFDFIWSSPPCQTHSRARFWSSKGGKVKTLYPDMFLYQEILLLTNYFKGRWCVENVIPYYKTLIQGQKIGRHMFWSNFYIEDFKHEKLDINKGNLKSWQKKIGLNIEGKKISQRKDQILRNCVEPELGKHILDLAIHPIQFQKTIF